jgi:hypothetical protein
MLLRYFLGDFEMVPIASTITGVTFVFKFHTRTVSVVTPLYFRTFWCLYHISVSHVPFFRYHRL